MGFWGLGIGDWAQSPIPNPQSPIPNPHILMAFKHFKLYFNLSNINKINMDQEGDVINNNI